MYTGLHTGFSAGRGGGLFVHQQSMGFGVPPSDIFFEIWLHY